MSLNPKRIIAPLLLASLNPLRRRHWHTIWVINAGSSKDNEAYFSPRHIPRLRDKHPLLPAGFFSSVGGMSLILGSMFEAHDLRQNRCRTQNLLSELSRWDANRIALNGAIPSIVSAHDLWGADPRLVKTQDCALWMLQEAARQQLARVKRPDAPILIVGAGRLGGALAKTLDHPVEVFDIKTLEMGQSFQRDLEKKVSGSDLIFLLTSRGNDGARMLHPYLRPDHIVVSDTHPRVDPRVAQVIESDTGATILNASLASDPHSVRWYPPVPGWSSEELPACLAEALDHAAPSKPAPQLLLRSAA